MSSPENHTIINLALRFLRWFCPEHLYEEIEGDLIQKFDRDVKKVGEKQAKTKLIWNVIRFFRPEILLRNKFSTNLPNSMMRNHIIFALRILSRNKVFAFVSVLGLSVSIATSVLIVQYAEFELSYDTFFKNQKNIYRLQHNRIANNEEIYKKAMTFPEVGLAMKDYFPEIEKIGRLFPASINIEPVFTSIADSGEKKSFPEPDAYLADSTFCSIFDLDFIHGDPASALSGPDRIILSRSAALRYFGKLDVVGRELKGNVGDFTVSGVFNDIPPNSHLKFEVLLSWWKVYGEGSRFTWDGFYNYIVLRDGTDAQVFEKKLPDFVQSYMGEHYKNQPGFNSQLKLQPVESIHLDSHLDGEMNVNGNRNVIYVLLVVACFIVVIAVINHVNLNASRSLERIKEIGIRKSIGSTKSQLSLQFLFESLLLNLSAAAIGLIAVWLLCPMFNELFNSSISLTFFRQPIFWLIISGFILSVSVIGAFYPAFMLTRFKVYDALKGLTVGVRKSNLQNGLVTLQFIFSLVLIIGTYVLLEQIHFMQSKDLGFGIERKLVVKILPGHGDEVDSTFNQKMIAVKNELLTTSFIKSSTISSSIPGRKNEWRGSTRLSGVGNDLVIRANLTKIDEDFVDAFDLKLIAGKNYISTLNNDKSIIVNEEALRQWGLRPEEGIGKKIAMMGDREIIGVVRSFHESGLHEVLSPTMFITDKGYSKFLTISMTTGDTPEQIAAVQKVWAKQFPDKPFQYFFLDDFFNKQYQSDVLMSRSVSLFSGIAIMIACLGLFSLSIHMIYRKTKEIGIKKILGASIENITSELSLKFMTPIGLSTIFGIPISYKLIVWWLNQYAYKIEITYGLFVVPVLALLGIGLLSVVFQTIRVAKKNPVESLRYE